MSQKRSSPEHDTNPRPTKRNKSLSAILDTFKWASSPTHVDLRNVTENRPHFFTHVFDIIREKGIFPTTLALPALTSFEVASLRHHMEAVPHIFVDLQTLSLSLSSGSEKSLRSVAQILAIPSLRSLEVFCFSYDEAVCDPSAFHVITDAIIQSQHLQCLREINFRYTEALGQEGGRLVGDMLQRATHLINLQDLDLEDTGLTPEGMRYVADGIIAAQGHLHSIRSLNFSSNPVGDEGLFHLARCLLLSTHLVTLESILIDSCEFGTLGITQLNRALSESFHLVSLHGLYISHNTFTNDDFHALCRVLVRYTRSLVQLHVRNMERNVTLPIDLASLRMLSRLARTSPINLNQVRRIVDGQQLAPTPELRKHLALWAFTLGLNNPTAHSSLNSFTYPRLYERHLVRLIGMFI